MNTEKYIIDILTNQDYLNLPGLGSFMVKQVPAEINSATNKFSPPIRKVVFTNTILTEDSVLQTYIINQENCTIEQAQASISVFAKKVLDTIEAIGHFDLKELGKFYLDRNGFLQFGVSEAKINLLEDSFGLPELQYKPLSKPTFKNRSQLRIPKYDRTQKKASIWKKVAVIPLAIIAIASFALFWQSSNSINSAGISFLGNSNKKVQPVTITATTPIIETIEPLSAANEPANAKIDSVNETVSTAEPEVKASALKKYSIIIGAFATRANAEKTYNEIVTTEKGSEILEMPDQKLIRVSIGTYSTKKEAVEKLEQVRSTFGETVWVLARNATN